MRHGLARIAADGRKKAREGTRERDRRNVAALQGKAESFFGETDRSINLPERPERASEVELGIDADIVAEPGGQMAIPLVIISRKGLFEVLARAGVIALA
jgi:hypothetical protein